MDALTLKAVDAKIARVIRNEATSFWLADALNNLCQRDVVDAAADAALLARLMRERADAALSLVQTL